MKKSTKGVVYIALDVHGNFSIGNPEEIDEAIEVLKENGLVLKIVVGLQDSFSCKVRFSVNKKRI